MANGRNGRRIGRGSRPSGPQLFQKNSISVAVTGNIIENLAALEEGIKQRVLRSGARAGAVVFYDEMRQRVPVRSGELLNSIYHYHDNKGSTPTTQTYFIGPNKTKAPHWHQVEFGHWLLNVVVLSSDGRFVASKTRLKAPKWVPPKAFVRPTWEAKKTEAINASRIRMGERLKEVMAGLA